jgi:hypothetical protein
MSASVGPNVAWVKKRLAASRVAGFSTAGGVVVPVPDPVPVPAPVPPPGVVLGVVPGVVAGVVPGVAPGVLPVVVAVVEPEPAPAVVPEVVPVFEPCDATTSGVGALSPPPPQAANKTDNEQATAQWVRHGEPSARVQFEIPNDDPF